VRHKKFAGLFLPGLLEDMLWHDEAMKHKPPEPIGYIDGWMK
jgi:hypothetical protein